MTPLLCALLLRVEVLGLLAPREASIDTPAGVVQVVAEGNLLRLEGARVAASAPSARFDSPGEGHPLRVRVAGLPAPRAFPGALELTARAGVLLFVSEVPLESYVAGVVEAELGPQGPPAALEALAVVVRSFAAHHALHPPRGQRHASDAPLCDQTHCQVYRGAATHAAPLAAARATEGEVLLLSSGDVAPALHHAACGGRTAGAREVWPEASEEDEEAGVAVDDPRPGPVPEPRRPGGPEGLAPRQLAACGALEGELPLAWTATVGEARLAKALGAQTPLALALEPGPEGLLRRLHVGGVGVLTAEGVHLKLGRALGWNLVRSPRFTLQLDGPVPGEPASYTLRGRGHGHGVGLCQRGASARATRGADRHQVLARFFPRLRVGPLPRGSQSR